jgi:hypothetical protein
MEEAALRKLIRATLSLAFVAAFSLASTANAATILGYTQTNPNDVVTERVVGATTVLTTGSGPAATFISILIGNIGGQSASQGAFVSFTLTAPGVASPGATSLNGFTGVIQISLTPGGSSILTATTSNGILTVNTGAGTAGLQADTIFSGYPPGGAIATQVGGPPSFGGSSLSFSNVTGTVATGFTAQHSATFSSVVPEPISLVSGSIAVLAGVGVFGFRRLGILKA